MNWLFGISFDSALLWNKISKAKKLCVWVDFTTLDILLHTKAVKKLRSDWFDEVITFKNPIIKGFQKKIYRFLVDIINKKQDLTGLFY